MAWLHAPEESSDDELVFRPEGYPLAPARGRMVLELAEDGSIAAQAPGPVDRPEPTELEGWASEGKDEGAFDEAADCGFKSGAEHVGGVLGGGRFAIFFPGELHKPSCKSEGCDHVRKAVVKILMK